MSSPLFTVVFPDGTTEYRSGLRSPVVGDVVCHFGENLVIAAVHKNPDGNTDVTLRHPEVAGEA